MNELYRFIGTCIALVLVQAIAQSLNEGKQIPAMPRMALMIGGGLVALASLLSRGIFP